MQTLLDIIEINGIVNSFFKDESKTTQWLNFSNPLLGDVSPMDMVMAGRTEKLKLFIKNQLEGHLP